MLKLSLILSCLFALHLAAMDPPDKNWARIAEFLSAENDPIDYQAPNLEHSDAQELQQDDDTDTFNPDSWVDELLSHDSLARIANILRKEDPNDYQEQNIFFDETEELNLEYGDMQEPQQHYYEDASVSGMFRSEWNIAEESSGNEPMNEIQNDESLTPAMIELQMQMENMVLMSQAHSWHEQTQASEAQPLPEQAQIINPPGRGRGFGPAMNQNGRGRGNRPMMNQNGLGRGNVPMMNQNGLGRGNVPMMNQNGLGRGNMQPANQNGRGWGAMRGRGTHPGMGHQQYALVAQQPIVSNANPAPAPQITNFVDRIATPRVQIPAEEYQFTDKEMKDFNQVVRTFKNGEFLVCRRPGKYSEEPWAKANDKEVNNPLARKKWAQGLVKAVAELIMQSIDENDFTQMGDQWFPALEIRESKVEKITLNATGTIKPDTYQKFLSMLQKNTKLTTLELLIGNMTDDDLFDLSQALRSSNIQHISIKNMIATRESTTFTQRGVLYLLNIAKKQKLKTIKFTNLGGEPIPQEFIQALAHEAGLLKLDISYAAPTATSHSPKQKRKTQ